MIMLQDNRRWGIACDICGEIRGNFETFGQAVDGMNDVGMTRYGMEDLCPDCLGEDE